MAAMDRLAMRRRGRAVAPYLLMAPALVLVAVFLYGVVNGVLQGFGIMPFLGLTDFTFDYWGEVLTRPDLAASVASACISRWSRRLSPLPAASCCPRRCAR